MPRVEYKFDGHFHKTIINNVLDDQYLTAMCVEDYISSMPDKELNKLKNLDVLILNSLRHNEHYSHINLTQAIEHIEELKPKKAFLTHIAPDMGLHSETEKILPKSVFLAFDGLEIMVND